MQRRRKQLSMTRMRLHMSWRRVQHDKTESDSTGQGALKIVTPHDMKKAATPHEEGGNSTRHGEGSNSMTGKGGSSTWHKAATPHDMKKVATPQDLTKKATSHEEGNFPWHEGHTTPHDTRAWNHMAQRRPQPSMARGDATWDPARMWLHINRTLTPHDAEEQNTNPHTHTHTKKTKSTTAGTKQEHDNFSLGNRMQVFAAALLYCFSIFIYILTLVAI